MKLKLTGLLLIILCNLNAQTKKLSTEVEWVTYTCGLSQKTVASNDTLIITPNPFDSIAEIQFTIANNDTIWLDVYNVIGTSIKSFYNATVLPSGSYSVTLLGDSISNGVYFVALKINSTKTLVKKLIKQTNAVGINENGLLKNIQLHPNPTNSILNFIDEQNQLQNSTIQIKDYLGQVVFTAPFTSQINLSNLPTGIYFLTIQNGTIIKTAKFIKQ